MVKLNNMNRLANLFRTLLLCFGLVFSGFFLFATPVSAESRMTALNNDRLWMGYFNKSGAGYLFTPDGDEFQVEAKDSVTIDV